MSKMQLVIPFSLVHASKSHFIRWEGELWELSLQFTDVLLTCCALSFKMAFCYKFHVLSSVQFFSHEIFGGVTDFSPSETQRISQRSSVSLFCIIQRHEMTCLMLCRRSATRTWNPHLLSPHFHLLNAGLSYLLQREVPKKGCCSLLP